jgi:hypothetical protein
MIDAPTIKVIPPGKRGRVRRKTNFAMGIPQWAKEIGLGDDERSLAIARKLLDQGDGPKVARRPDDNEGVRPRDHLRWLRTQPWVKCLSKNAASPMRQHKRGRR